MLIWMRVIAQKYMRMRFASWWKLKRKIHERMSQNHRKKSEKFFIYIATRASAEVSHNMHIFSSVLWGIYEFYQELFVRRVGVGSVRCELHRRLWDAPGVVSKTRISCPSFLRGEKWSELRTMKHDRLTDFSFSQLLPRQQLRSCFDNLRVIFVQPVSILFHL